MNYNIEIKLNATDIFSDVFDDTGSLNQYIKQNIQRAVVSEVSHRFIKDYFESQYPKFQTELKESISAELIETQTKFTKKIIEKFTKKLIEHVNNNKTDATIKLIDALKTLLKEIETIK